MKLEQTVYSCYGMDVTHCPHCHDTSARAELNSQVGLWNEERKWAAMVCCAVAHAIDGAEKVARCGTGL